MMKKDVVVIALNGALAVGLCVLVGLGKVSWEQFLGGLGLLLAPSAFGARADRAS